MKKDISRRRKERANLDNHLKGVYLDCPALSFKNPLRVVNISELGLAIKVVGISISPTQVEQKFFGSLTVRYTVVSVELILIHKSEGLIGFDFVNPSTVLQDMVNAYFEAELIGRYFRLSSHTHLLWKYTDLKSNSLEIKGSSDQNLESFAFNVMGNRIEWGGKFLDLTLIQNHRQVHAPESMRKQLITLIGNATVVTTVFRKKIDQILKRIPTNY